MTEGRERRYNQRHQFPDSNVFCQESAGLGIFKQFSEPFPLIDLTKSGLGFQTNKDLGYGDKVHLKIEIPGYQKIHVIGEIRWVSTIEKSDQKNVGVQFLPFGTMKGYNSFSAREKLESLINPLEQTKPPQKEMLQ